MHCDFDRSDAAGIASFGAKGKPRTRFKVPAANFGTEKHCCRPTQSRLNQGCDAQPVRQYCSCPPSRAREAFFSFPWAVTGLETGSCPGEWWNSSEAVVITGGHGRAVRPPRQGPRRRPTRSHPLTADRRWTAGQLGKSGDSPRATRDRSRKIVNDW
jgi:hypothetical protein